MLMVILPNNMQQLFYVRLIVYKVNNICKNLFYRFYFILFISILFFPGKV